MTNTWKPTCIIFNGPPGSGKTTAAKYMANTLRDLTPDDSYVYQDSFAGPMKHFVSTGLGERYQKMDKAKPRQEFRGRSVREFLIHFSEAYMKEEYGKQIFAKMLITRINSLLFVPAYVVIDDTGFPIEYDTIVDTFPTVLVRIMRDGHTYDGDSRHYLSNPTHTIYNNSDVLNLQRHIDAIITPIIANGPKLP